MKIKINMKINNFSGNMENQNGQVAMFIVFVIMAILLFMTLFLVNMTTKQTTNLRNSLHSVQAYYYADMGAERTLWGIRQPLASPNKININDFDIITNPVIISKQISSNPQEASYTVTRIDTTGSEFLGIRSLGVYVETSRAIKLTW